MVKLNAITQVCAFEHEQGYVIISNKVAMEKYSTFLGLRVDEVWIVLTSVTVETQGELDTLFTIKGQLVSNISSTIPHETLEKISIKLKLESCLSAAVEAGMLAGVTGVICTSSANSRSVNTPRSVGGVEGGGQDSQGADKRSG